MKGENKMKLKMIVALGCAFLLASCQSMPMNQSTNDKNNTVETKKSAVQVSDFKFQTLDGKEVSLSEYKGKKIYIKFWATWCPTCLAGLQDVTDLSQNPPENAVVLTVVAPGVNREKNVDDFKTWFNGVDYKALPVLMDMKGEFLKKLGVVGYPTSVFINENGEVVKVQPGHLKNQDITKTLLNL